MNAGRKPDRPTKEIDEVAPLSAAGDGKKKRGVDQVGAERRSGIEQRCFSYTAYLPERRSGHDRRGTDEI